MTVSSSARKARRAARRQGASPAAERGATILTMAAQLAGLAAADHTISGATIMMPDGDMMHITVREALQLIGQAPAAGRA